MDRIKIIQAVLKGELHELTTTSLEEFFLNNDNENTSSKLETASSPALEAKAILEGINHDFEIMETHTKGVEKGLNTLLELKQMQANLWEARSSRERAEETARQDSDGLYRGHNCLSSSILYGFLLCLGSRSIS